MLKLTKCNPAGNSPGTVLPIAAINKVGTEVNNAISAAGSPVATIIRPLFTLSTPANNFACANRNNRRRTTENIS